MVDMPLNQPNQSFMPLDLIFEINLHFRKKESVMELVSKEIYLSNFVGIYIYIYTRTIK